MGLSKTNRDLLDGLAETQKEALGFPCHGWILPPEQEAFEWITDIAREPRVLGTRTDRTGNRYLVLHGEINLGRLQERIKSYKTSTILASAEGVIATEALENGVREFLVWAQVLRPAAEKIIEDRAACAAASS